MTLNGVIALILRYFTEFDRLGGRSADYVTVIEVRPTRFGAEYPLPVKFWPMQQSHCLFAKAELLVQTLKTAFSQLKGLSSSPVCHNVGMITKNRFQLSTLRVTFQNFSRGCFSEPAHILKEVWHTSQIYLNPHSETSWLHVCRPIYH